MFVGYLEMLIMGFKSFVVASFMHFVHFEMYIKLYLLLLALVLHFKCLLACNHVCTLKFI